MSIPSLYSSSLDDDDSQVAYRGSWSRGRAGSTDYHSSSSVGATVTVRNLQASRIAILCIIPSGRSRDSVVATIAIDGGTPQRVSYPSASANIYTVFWDSGPLAFGPHSLQITVGDDQKPFQFDRIDYEATDRYSPARIGATSARASSSSSPSPPTVTTTSTSTMVFISPSSTASTSSINSTNSLVGTSSTSDPALQGITPSSSPLSSLTTDPSSTSSPSPLSAASNNKSPPSWGIALGVIGALIFVGLVVIVFLKKRQRAMTAALAANRNRPMSIFGEGEGPRPGHGSVSPYSVQPGGSSGRGTLGHGWHGREASYGSARPVDAADHPHYNPGHMQGYGVGDGTSPYYYGKPQASTSQRYPFEGVGDQPHPVSPKEMREREATRAYYADRDARQAQQAEQNAIRGDRSSTGTSMYW